MIVASVDLSSFKLPVLRANEQEQRPTTMCSSRWINPAVARPPGATLKM
jgi:hypothetical protein